MYLQLRYYLLPVKKVLIRMQLLRLSKPPLQTGSMELRITRLTPNFPLKKKIDQPNRADTIEKDRLKLLIMKKKYLLYSRHYHIIPFLQKKHGYAWNSLCRKKAQQLHQILERGIKICAAPIKGLFYL